MTPQLCAARLLAVWSLCLTGVPAVGEVLQAEPDELRVCADPNNLPFSNAAREGFENKIAQVVASDLGKKLSYVWWAQRRGWYRHTLKEQVCDVMMGVPSGLDLVLTTHPYYTSSYVFVYRTDRNLNLTSITDARLRSLKIGVHLLGSDGYNTPPAHVLGNEGIVENVKGYSIYGDYREPNPPARIIDAVQSGEIDVAAVWGPLGGYAASRSAVPLKVVPIDGTEGFRPFRFQFEMSMAVRKNNLSLKERLDAVIVRHTAEIRDILAAYGIPVLEAHQSQAKATERDR